MRRWILVLTISVCIAPSVRADNPNAEDAQARMQAAQAVVEPPFEFFYVPSPGGAIAKATFLTLSKSKGPSNVGKQLAAELDKPRSELRTIVVSGPSDAVTKQVIVDALELSTGKKLENLKLVFVGDARVASKLRVVVEEAGAQFASTELQGGSNNTMKSTR